MCCHSVCHGASRRVTSGRPTTQRRKHSPPDGGAAAESNAHAGLRFIPPELGGLVHALQAGEAMPVARMHEASGMCCFYMPVQWLMP